MKYIHRATCTRCSPHCTRSVLYFYFTSSVRLARAGGGAAGFLLLFYFPCSADHERDWPPCKVRAAFFGLATNTLNVCLFVFVYIPPLTDDEPQRARLHIPPIITATLPTCLWSLRIFQPLTSSCQRVFYRDASLALLLHLVNKWLNFTFSRSHAFRCGSQNKKTDLVKSRIELRLPLHDSGDVRKNNILL